MHQPKIVLLLISALFAQALNAQHAVFGTVIDETQNSQPFVNVLLINPSDSSLVRGAVTDDSGMFRIENIAPAQYQLLTRSIGFQSVYSQVFDLTGDLDIGEIMLKEGVELDEVQVVARKPLYEQKIDRLVVNVESSVTSAGSTALDILERSPGVIVNRQNAAISLVGKDGVVIMINGNINYMPVDAVVQMLEGMSADNIESIELITTPPAKFDAEGNAGYINIVLRSSSEDGTNGSYTLGGGYGDGPVASASINFNHRRAKVNFFGSYSFLRENQAQFFLNYRKVFQASGDVVESRTTTDRDPTQRNHNLRLGADFELSAKTVLGVLIAAYDNKWTMDAFNHGTIKTNGSLDTVIEMPNVERNQWQHAMANVNLAHDLNDKHALSMDLDLLHYRDENPTSYDITYLDGQRNLLFNRKTKSDKVTPIDIAVGKFDYTGTLNDRLNISAGIKGVVSSFTNDVDVTETINGITMIDPEFTSESDLVERIYAAYGSVDYKPGVKTTLQFGLRYEYTDSQLDTDEQPRLVDRSFGELFPSIFLSHELNDHNSINLSYSRRITRPTFQDMAPFVIFLDPNTFFAGNAGIQPAIANTYQAGFRHNSLLLNLTYTREDSTIARFQEEVDLETNRHILVSNNLSNTRTLAFTLGFPVYVSNGWQMQNNFMIIGQEINAFFDDAPVQLNQTNFRLNTLQSFELPKNWSFELSGFYQSRSLFGTAELEGFYGINAGLSKDFGDRWGKLTVAVDDIFNSIIWDGGTIIPGEDFETFGSYDFSRTTFRINYARNFGNAKLKAARERTTGSEEERRRVN